MSSTSHETSITRPSPSSLADIFAAEQSSRTCCDGFAFLNEAPAVSICSASTVFVLPTAFLPARMVMPSAKSMLFSPKLRQSRMPRVLTCSPTATS